MKVAIYTRVSTEVQSVDMQLSELRQFAGHRGFEIYREYCDIGISGSKDSRPQLNELMNDARKKRFDAILVWRFDRFARSTRHLINALHDFNYIGIDFISFSENIDTSNPTGKVLFTIISAMAEFERDIIRERVKAGIANAKQKGIKLGRPTLINKDIAERIREFRKEGKSIRAVAKQVRVSPSLVHKILSNSESLNIEKSSRQETAL